jgi:hypothetical protein
LGCFDSSLNYLIWLAALNSFSKSYFGQVWALPYRGREDENAATPLAGKPRMNSVVEGPAAQPRTMSRVVGKAEPYRMGQRPSRYALSNHSTLHGRAHSIYSSYL